MVVVVVVGVVVVVVVVVVARMAQKRHAQTSRNFLGMLRVDVAYPFPDDSATRYVLPVL